MTVLLAGIVVAVAVAIALSMFFRVVKVSTRAYIGTTEDLKQTGMYFVSHK